MKIVLTPSVPWDFTEIYPSSMSHTSRWVGSRFGVVTGVTEPLGLLLVAASLRAAGFEPVVVDGYGWQDATWYSKILDEQPDLLGISMTAYGWSQSAPYVKRLKELRPSLTIVAGGPYPSAVGAAGFEEIPDLDYLVRGDGELAMTALASALAAGRSADGIAGLVRNGQPEAEAVVGTTVVLDDLPIAARDLVDLARYKPSVGFYNRLPSMSMMTTRGCPVRCRFCISANEVSYRSVDLVLDEIEHEVAQFGIRHVLFWDEDIAIHKHRAVEFAEGLLRRGIDISWCANMTLWKAEDRELLALLRRAGCWKLLFGIESGVAKNLRAVDKPLNLDRVKGWLQGVSDTGIETFATFLFGIPGETREEAMRTFHFAKTLPIDYALFLNFVPFPGTPYYAEIEKHGTFLGPWSTQAVSFVPHTMTAEDLEDLRVLAYRGYYLRPAYILRRLRRIRSWEDVRRNLRGLVATLSMRRRGEVVGARAMTAAAVTG